MDNKQRLQYELDVFESNLKLIQKKKFKIIELDDFVYVITPARKFIQPHNKQDKIDIVFGAIVHGNEKAGIAVLNSTLDQICKLSLLDNFTCGFFLGNIEAYKKEQRFIEKDLNRAFNSSEDNTCLETKRAKAIQKLLKRAQYFIDFHQTTQKSSTPFFIFPYTNDGLIFARYLNPFIPIVTHWEESYSSEGVCTDEYVNLNGGVGITIELGQAGFDPYQIAFGNQIAINAIKFIKMFLTLNKKFNITQLKSTLRNHLYQNIFKVHTVIRETKNEVISLKEGFYNFCPIKKYDVIGTTSTKENIKSPINGYILFPRYKTKDKSHNKSKEVCRILKKVLTKELPNN